MRSVRRQSDTKLTEIGKAEKALEDGRFTDARSILAPLVETNVPEAIRINASFFDKGTSEEEMDRRYVDGMFKAAELGDKEARYRVGIFYDVGEYGVPLNKKRASEIFRELAEDEDRYRLQSQSLFHVRRNSLLLFMWGFHPQSPEVFDQG